MRAKRGLTFSTILNVALVGIVVLVLAAGASSRFSTQLVVKSLQVVDSKGTVRLTLSVDDNDQPLLQVLDRKGVPVVSLDLGLADEPSLVLNNVNGETQLSLSLANGDLPWLDMNGKNGQEIVSLGLNSYGAPSLEMSAVAYKRHADIRFDETGYFGFAAYGPDYEDRLRLGLNAGGNPAFELFGVGEERLACLSLDDNRPGLTLWDDKGQVLLKVPTNVREGAAGPSN